MILFVRSNLDGHDLLTLCKSNICLGLLHAKSFEEDKLVLYEPKRNLLNASRKIKQKASCKSVTRPVGRGDKIYQLHLCKGGGVIHPS